MPNISKINAVDIGNIAKVDGATSSNIAKVDGLDFVTLLLDTYTGAAAGYSVRQLKSGVTVAMRVRRDTAGGTGDDDEADIAFDTSLTDPAISLDSAISNTTSSASTLGQFLNVGTVGGTTYTNPDSLTVTASCFVNEWKDQSGNANHASQATFGSQPQIHSGTVNTNLITENGKPALDFDGVDDGLDLDTSGLDIGSLSSFTVGRPVTGSNGMMLALSGTTNDKRWYAPFPVDSDTRFGYGNSPTAITVTRDNFQHIFTMIAGSTQGDVEAWIDGTSAGTATLSTGIDSASNGIGYFSGSFQLECSVQEVIIYGSDQSGNRTGIESDIDTYFSIP